MNTEQLEIIALIFVNVLYIYIYIILYTSIYIYDLILTLECGECEHPTPPHTLFNVYVCQCLCAILALQV